MTSASKLPSPMKIKNSHRILNYGSRRIKYQLIRAARKRLRIVVLPNLKVKVYVPDSISDDDIIPSIKKKAHWISKQLDHFDKYHPLPTLRKYISGETFIYLGRQYRLKVEKRSEKVVKLQGKYLHVSTPDKSNNIDVRKLVDNWYRTRANDIFHRYMQKCYNVASRHGIPEAKIVIRKMRTRWGSCSSRGKITLNIKLVQTPIHCIEYVIMHELCHLKYHNHSKQFYRLLSRCMPDWKRKKSAIDLISVSDS